MKDFDDFVELLSSEDSKDERLETFEMAAESVGLNTENGGVQIDLKVLPEFLASYSHLDTMRVLRRYHEWMSKTEGN